MKYKFKIGDFVILKNDVRDTDTSHRILLITRYCPEYSSSGIPKYWTIRVYSSVHKYYNEEAWVSEKEIELYDGKPLER